jgi:ABC-type uncharacterized transport system permease subunit
MTISSLDLMALATQFPILALAWRRDPSRDHIFWLLLAAAFSGPFLWSIIAHSEAWKAQLTAALWTTVATTWGLFTLLCICEKGAWRLISIIAPVLFIMAILAFIWSGQHGHGPSVGLASLAQDIGLGLHITVSVATYGLLTIAAAAGWAGIIQDRALKSKQPSARSRNLPALIDCDAFMFLLLSIAEVVLALGLASGIALQFQETRQILAFDHKTILALVAFGLIAVLLVTHHLSGLRGRKAARWVLSAYLCLTLGYPGVKFVTDVILN